MKIPTTELCPLCFTKGKNIFLSSEPWGNNQIHITCCEGHAWKLDITDWEKGNSLTSDNYCGITTNKNGL